MDIKTIVHFLEQKAPAHLAEEWDNVGVLVEAGNEVTGVVTALDATPDAIAFAKQQGADLLVTHHPVIFSPLSHLSMLDPAVQALQNGVSVLSLHTNLDKAVDGVNDTLCALLGLQNVTVLEDGMTRVGDLPAPMTAKEFGGLVGDTLHTPVMISPGDTVSRVAVCGGAAGSGVFTVKGKADAYVTGEVKHHEFLAANGLTVVAAGHYATEVPVVDTLTRWLKTAFPTLPVTPFYGKAPYEVITR